MVYIRAAEPGDVSTIAVINVRGWQAAFREIIPEDFLDQMDPEERESFVDQMISNGAPYHVAVADDQGEVVGYVSSALPYQKISMWPRSMSSTVSTSSRIASELGWVGV